MPIDFNCPHCSTPYRLKDELAGKRATCKNAACRQIIVVPQPSANGTHPPPTDAEIEAAALAALNEVAKEEAKPVEQSIPIACSFCGHQWTEPFSKAGKNVLCPNPECRQRTKVPDLKKDQVSEDWRTGRGNKPSLAKENYEKLEGVQDAGDAKVVTRKSMKEGGALDDEIEPRPLKQKLLFVGLGLSAVVGIVLGVVFFVGSRKEKGKDRLIDDAVKEYADTPGFAKDDKEFAAGSTLGPPATGPLYGAILHVAAGEYHLRHNTDEGLKLALDEFGKARTELQNSAARDDAKHAAALERAAVACELAMATLLLGEAEDGQAKANLRLRWHPDAPVGRKLRVNERVFTVHEELRKAAQQLQAADFDLKAALARRMVRVLAKRGEHGAILAGDLPVLLFADSEQMEAKAVVAIELFRADNGSPKARQIADELKGKLAQPGDYRPYPASAVTLWEALVPPVEKPPQVVPPPSSGQGVNDGTRLAYTGLLALKGKPDEALLMLQRSGGSPAGQFRAALAYAEYAADPVPALAFAAALAGKKLEPAPPPSVLFRLSQVAAAAGKPDLVTAFVEAILDEGLKAWAKADAFRLALKPESKEPVAEAAAEVPDDARKLRAGHVWGRYWLARQNARAAGDRDKQLKAVTAWAKGTIHPLGLAGIALGLQDQ